MVVIMMMIISFCFIGMSRKVSMTGAAVLSFNGFRYIQQSGTDLDPGILRRSLIDLEPYAAVFNNESDHTTVAEKTIPFAHGQNSRSQARKKFTDIFFRPADKQYSARFRRGGMLYSLGDHFPAVHNFSRRDLIQRAPEGVVAQNADGDRRVWRHEGRRRPLDEFGEVQQECRLHLVLQGCIRRLAGARQTQAKTCNQTYRNRGMAQPVSYTHLDVYKRQRK